MTPGCSKHRGNPHLVSCATCQRILFSEDRHDAPVLRFQRDDNGNYYCQGVRRTAY